MVEGLEEDMCGGGCGCFVRVLLASAVRVLLAGFFAAIMRGEMKIMDGWMK